MRSGIAARLGGDSRIHVIARAMTNITKSQSEKRRREYIGTVTQSQHAFVPTHASRGCPKDTNFMMQMMKGSMPLCLTGNES